MQLLAVSCLQFPHGSKIKVWLTNRKFKRAAQLSVSCLGPREMTKVYEDVYISELRGCITFYLDVSRASAHIFWQQHIQLGSHAVIESPHGRSSAAGHQRVCYRPGFPIHCTQIGSCKHPCQAWRDYPSVQKKMHDVCKDVLVKRHAECFLPAVHHVDMRR